MPRTHHTKAATAATAAAAALLLAACGGSGSASSGAASERAQVSHVSVNTDDCGGRWRATSTGHAAIAVKSDYATTQIADVYLANAHTGAVYDEVDGLAPGATYRLSAVLQSGRYQLQCYVSDDNPQLGPVVRVDRTVKAHQPLTPGVVPITFGDLVPPTKAYQRWVESRLPVLLNQIGTLATKAQKGATPAAKQAWLTAHLTYERLGAAYDAFGDLNDSINGFPPGSETWRQDRDLTGFHLIEGLLWSNAPKSRLEPAITQLKGDVQKLIRQFQTVEIEPFEITLRAHEIIENAIQFELTGQTDTGSHTNLATISANIWGAQKALSFTASILRSRYPQLGQTEQALAASKRLVDSFEHDGQWAPLQRLSTDQDERVDASLTGLVELLAPIATIGDIRNVPVGDSR